jgi:hypothetical protein
MQIPMSPDQFTVLRQKAGIAPDTFAGTVDQQGVMAEWKYAEGVFTATILKKPRMVPEALIWNRFRKWAGM